MKWRRLTIWTLAVLAIATVDRLTFQLPPAARMLALIGVLFLSMKAIVLNEETKEAPSGVRLAAFVFGWFGMRPGVFVRRAGKPLAHGRDLIIHGARFLTAGLLTIAAARFLPRPLTGMALLIGCSLTLHFGVLGIVAGAWRLAGFDCRALFREPWRASTLAEFWGRRWNIAFSEMISIAVVRTLTPSIGPRWARLAGFAASGLLHEVAITLPVGAGYGLPTLYFLLQGVLVDAELARPRLAHRALTLAGVILPAALVFTPAFVDAIVMPLAGR